MSKLLVTAVMLAAIGAATAQDAPAKVKTERIAPTSVRPMYQIDNDGVVSIDWARVEQVAKSADLSNDIARVMLAIRDGQAHSIQH